MKPSKTNTIFLNEWWQIAGLALEAGMELLAAENRGLQSELTESEFLELFTKKYNHPISLVLKRFETDLYTLLNSADTSFFSRENFMSRIANLPIETPENIGSRDCDEILRDKGLKESIDLDFARKNLLKFLFENEQYRSIRFATGGLSDQNKLTTLQTPFKWGRYEYPNPSDKYFKRKSKIAGSDYWILDGEKSLGDIQEPGDPFTYKDLGGSRFQVISAPGSIDPETGKSYKDSIGKIFTKNKVEEVQETTISSAYTYEQEYEICKQTQEDQKGADHDAAEERKIAILEMSDLNITENGALPALSWIAIDQIVGVQTFSERFSRAAYSILLREIRADGCESRRGMVMVLVAHTIISLANKTIDNISNDSILYKDNIFLNTRQAKLDRRIFKLTEKIESIAYEIRDYLLEKWEDVANMKDYRNDDLDDPRSFWQDIIGGSDNCGYDLNASGKPREPSAIRKRATQVSQGRPRWGSLPSPIGSNLEPDMQGYKSQTTDYQVRPSSNIRLPAARTDRGDSDS